jgi:hypothetical protein
MHEEPTTVIVQRYLDALPGDTAAELTVRELLERAAGRLRLLCTTLLYKSYEVNDRQLKQTAWTCTGQRTGVPILEAC